MSQNQEYPEAFAIYNHDRREWTMIFDTQEHQHLLPQEYADEDMPSTVVKLIPAPTVERLVGEAEQRGRDAERERCRRIAIVRGAVAGMYGGDMLEVSRDGKRWKCPEMRGRMLESAEILRLIEGDNPPVFKLEIESGEQPGEGGE